MLTITSQNLKPHPRTRTLKKISQDRKEGPSRGIFIYKNRLAASQKSFHASTPHTRYLQDLCERTSSCISSRPPQDLLTNTSKWSFTSSSTRSWPRSSCKDLWEEPAKSYNKRAACEHPTQVFIQAPVRHGVCKVFLEGPLKGFHEALFTKTCTNLWSRSSCRDLNRIRSNCPKSVREKMCKGLLKFYTSTSRSSCNCLFRDDFTKFQGWFVTVVSGFIWGLVYVRETRKQRSKERRNKEAKKHEGKEAGKEERQNS